MLSNKEFEPSEKFLLIAIVNLNTNRTSSMEFNLTLYSLLSY